MEIRTVSLRHLPVIAAIAAVVLAAVLARLLPHPYGFTPIPALALFGGVYINKRFAFIVPLTVMAITDFFLGYSQSTPYVYASLVFTGFLGYFLRTRKTVQNVLVASITSSVIFFLITNFNYWLPHGLYPKTFEGQLQAYLMGLPFFRNMLLGDLFFTGLFFGSYELVKLLIEKHSVIGVKSN